MSSRSREILAVLLITAVGAYVRAALPVSSGFPLNDGGLFYQMVLDLQGSFPALPSTTSYNDLGAPFAYPPLGIYLGAGLHGVLGFEVMRVVPVGAAILTVPAFHLLARSWFSASVTSLAATGAFALSPRSFEWLTMGGGLTRAPGLLAALLALWLTHRLLRDASPGRALAAGLAGGAVALTHPQAALFTVLSGAILCIALLRDRRTALHVGGAVVLAALLALPWLAWVVATHGAAPLTSAAVTQPGPFIGLLSLLTFEVTGSRLFDVVGMLAAVGALLSVVRGSYLLPAWLAATMILDARGGATFAIIPAALLAGRALVDLVIAPFWLETASRARHALDPARAFLLAALVAVAAVDAVGSQSAPTWPGVPLSPEQVAAMERVADGDDGGRYLVVTDRFWATDAVAEWFPTLTGAHSAATVQGFEWLGSDRFGERVRAAEGLRECAAGAPGCLEAWSEEWQVDFTHVFIPKGSLTGPLGTDDCCPALRGLMAADPGYSMTFDGPGATIFERADD